MGSFYAFQRFDFKTLKILKKTRFQQCCLDFSYIAHYGHYSVLVSITPKRHFSVHIISLGDIVVFTGIFTLWYLTTPKTCKNHIFANVENFLPKRVHFMRFIDLVPMILKTLKRQIFSIVVWISHIWLIMVTIAFWCLKRHKGTFPSTSFHLVI